MLYVKSIKRDEIRLFETHTNSSIVTDIHELNKLVRVYKMEIANADLSTGSLKLNEWPQKMRMNYNDTEYYDTILLTQLGEDKYKVAGGNNKIEYLNKEQLISYINRGDVANCEYIKYKGKEELKVIDIYKTTEDIEFEKQIDKQYKDYQAKSKLIGLDNSFEYIIEGKEVKLLEYTGASKKVVLPNFITSICHLAFGHTVITDIKLNSGLKYIGTHAFRNASLSELVIPETVEFICTGAFLKNKGLRGGRNVKIMGDTILLSKVFYE